MRGVAREQGAGALLAALLLLAGAAHADLACDFASECFEEDGCTFTQLRMVLETGETVQMVTDAETVPGVLSTRDDGGHVFQGGNDNGAWQMVTGPRGLARLAVMYFEGPMMITYFGQCEGK